MPLSATPRGAGGLLETQFGSTRSPAPLSPKVHVNWPLRGDVLSGRRGVAAIALGKSRKQRGTASLLGGDCKLGGGGRIDDDEGRTNVDQTALRRTDGLREVADRANNYRERPDTMRSAWRRQPEYQSTAPLDW